MQFRRVITAAGFLTALGAASAAAQPTVYLSIDTPHREVWRGQTNGSAASFSLDRGDLNTGDSRRDMIVGAPGWNNERGRVYVVFGGPVQRGEVPLSTAHVILSGTVDAIRQTRHHTCPCPGDRKPDP